MTTKTPISASLSPRQATLSDLAHAGLLRVAQRAQRWRRRRLLLWELNELLQMEDHVLRDVGFTRRAIRAEIAALRPGLPQSLHQGF